MTEIPVPYIYRNWLSWRKTWGVGTKTKTLPAVCDIQSAFISLMCPVSCFFTHFWQFDPQNTKPRI